MEKKCVSEINNQNDYMTLMSDYLKDEISNLIENYNQFYKNFQKLIDDEKFCLVKAEEHVNKRTFKSFDDYVIVDSNSFNNDLSLNNTSNKSLIEEEMLKFINEYNQLGLVYNKEIIRLKEKMYSLLNQQMNKIKQSIIFSSDVYYEGLNSELETLIEKNEIFKKEINNEFYEYEKLKEDFFQSVINADMQKLNLNNEINHEKEYQQYTFLKSKSDSLLEILKLKVNKLNSLISDSKIVNKDLNKVLKQIQKGNLSFSSSQEIKFSKFLISIGGILQQMGHEIEEASSDINKNISSLDISKSEIFGLKDLNFGEVSIKDIEFKAKMISSERVNSIIMSGDITKIKRNTANLNGLDMLSSKSNIKDIENKASFNEKLDFDYEILRFYNILLKEEEISDSLNKYINDMINLNKKNGIIFIKKLIEIKQDNVIVCVLYKNLSILSNIIIKIIESEYDSKEISNNYNHNLYLSIIYFSEKTYIIKSNKKRIYLSHLISKCSLFQNDNFWISLFYFKYEKNIFEKIKNAYPKLINLNYKKRVSLEINENNLNTEYDLEITDNKRIIDVVQKEKESIDLINSINTNLLNGKSNAYEKKSIFNKIIDIFNNKPTDIVESLTNINQKRNSKKLSVNFILPHRNSQIYDIKTRERGIFLENNESDGIEYMNNDIDIYYYENIIYILNNPTKEQDQYIQMIKIEEAVFLLKFFLNYFSMFDFEISRSIEIIDKINKDFNLPKEHLLYLKILVENNNYNIKARKMIKSTIDEKEKVSFSILSSIKYINSNTIYNYILTLNKRINSSLMIEIYTNEIKKTDLIYKNIDSIQYEQDINNIHLNDFLINKLNCWKCILKISQMKKEIDYEKLKNLIFILNKKYDIEKIIMNKKKLHKQEIVYTSIFEHDDFKFNSIDIVDDFNIIELDVQRTFFKFDLEKNRIAIENILKASVLYFKGNFYCQGMNYLVAFLFLLTMNEEDTFYIFVSLIKNTDYGSFFHNDLKKVKEYFYIIDRLLILYTPELNSFFYKNKIGCNFFTSAWIMTLFTNCYQIEEYKISYIILKIFDEFILNGWYSLIKSVFIIIILYENKLLYGLHDDFLTFIFNEILKNGFFRKDNFSLFLNKWNDFQLPNSLLDRLSIEYNQGLSVINFNERIYSSLNIS